MTKFAENYFFKGTILLIIFLNVYGAIDFFVPNLKKSFAFMISLLVSPLLTPSLKYIQTRGINSIQLKWLFFKKPLIFNC